MSAAKEGVCEKVEKAPLGCSLTECQNAEAEVEVDAEKYSEQAGAEAEEASEVGS